MERLGEAPAFDEHHPVYRPLDAAFFGGVPLPFNRENSHILVLGASGTGKGQAIKQYLYDLRRRGGSDRFVIYDRKPEYARFLFRPGDHIICPADRRHTPWDMFQEINTRADVLPIIRSLLPEDPKADQSQKFWVSNGRGVFEGIVQWLRDYERERFERGAPGATGKPSHYELCRFIYNQGRDIEGLWKAIKTNEDAASMAGPALSALDTSPQSNVPSGSMATLSATFSSFTSPEVAERGWFSLKRWLCDPATEGTALFLTSSAQYADNYKAYFSLMIDFLLRATLSLPDNTNRRIHFALDEFRSLQPLDSITGILAEGRSKGACVLLGAQAFADIEQNYDKKAISMTTSCNTQLFARVGQYKEAEDISKAIGEMEVEREEGNENLQMGKDGVSSSVSMPMSGGRRERRSVILPSEIQGLPDMNYLIKMGNDVGEPTWMRSKIGVFGWGGFDIYPEFIQKPDEAFELRRLRENFDQYMEEFNKSQASKSAKPGAARPGGAAGATRPSGARAGASSRP